MKLKKIASEQFPCRILRFKDGDTVVIRVQLGFNVELTLTVRLAAIESWELRNDPNRSPNFPAIYDQARAKRAAEQLTALFENAPATFVPYHSNPDKYGRWIGELLTAEKPITGQILALNLAWPRENQKLHQEKAPNNA